MWIVKDGGNGYTFRCGQFLNHAEVEDTNHGNHVACYSIPLAGLQRQELSEKCSGNPRAVAGCGNSHHGLQWYQTHSPDLAYALKDPM